MTPCLRVEGSSYSGRMENLNFYTFFLYFGRGECGWEVGGGRYAGSTTRGFLKILLYNSCRRQEDAGGCYSFSLCRYRVVRF